MSQIFVLGELSSDDHRIPVILVHGFCGWGNDEMGGNACNIHFTAKPLLPTPLLHPTARRAATRLTNPPGRVARPRGWRRDAALLGRGV